MGVGGGAEGDEDGGASGGGYFRHGDRARAADDQICLGKALRHVLDKGKNLRVEFAPRISVSHRIIVAFSGLMHDEKLIFSHNETIERVHHRPIDRKSPAAASGDQDPERRRGALCAESGRTRDGSAHPVTTDLPPKRVAVSW